jgi:hypothetical protein
MFRAVAIPIAADARSGIPPYSLLALPRASLENILCRPEALLAVTAKK